MQWRPTGFKLWLAQHHYPPDSHHSMPLKEASLKLHLPHHLPSSPRLTIMRGFSAFSWKCPLTTSLSAAQLWMWPVVVGGLCQEGFTALHIQNDFLWRCAWGEIRRENPLRLESETSPSKERINYLSPLRNLIKSNAAGKSQAAVTWSKLLHPDWILWPEVPT